MSVNGFINILTTGLTFNVDPFNIKSYVSGSTYTYDLSKNITGGTLVNGVSYDGFSFTFDGTDDYINFGNVLNMSTDNFSLVSWVKLQNNSNWQQIIAKRDTGINYYGYEIRCSPSGEPQFILHGDNYPCNRLLTTSIYDNEWHHICAVADVSGDALLIYIDGVLNTTGSSDGSPIGAGSVNTPTSLHIGMRGGGYLNGRVSNSHIFRKALSSEEVLQLYNVTKWRFQ